MLFFNINLVKFIKLFVGMDVFGDLIKVFFRVFRFLLWGMCGYKFIMLVVIKIVFLGNLFRLFNICKKCLVFLM